MDNTKNNRVCDNLQESYFKFVILKYYNNDIEDLLSNFSEIKKFKVYRKISKNITHVIVNSCKKLIPITYEFLLALIYGIPIVTLEWLISCQILNLVYDYREYYVVGTPQYPWHAVALSQISRMHQKKIFEGYKIYVDPCKLIQFNMDDFHLTRIELANLLRASGAKLLKKNPLRNKKPFKKCNHTYIKVIIYSPSDETKPCNIYKYLGRGIWYLSVHWVVVSILRQKALRLLKYQF